jgi:hypothetical protein
MLSLATPDIAACLRRRVCELGCDPEMELRVAARRYLDLVRAWEDP